MPTKRRRKQVVPGLVALAIAVGVAASAPAARPASAETVIGPPFSPAVAAAHVATLASFGPRIAGRWPEQRAADYIAARLRSWGYSVRVQTFAVPGGLTSRNVIAYDPGRSAKQVVLGAHMDSKHPSPGANDNASGSAVLLELARIARQTDQLPGLRFVFFGAEEMTGADPEDHHFGSRAYLHSMTDAERAATAGMVSVDMVGYGTEFTVRSMGVGPQDVVESLQRRAWADGVGLRWMQDTRRGQSDHEPFERAGIPAAWLEWRDDPVYHTTADVASHVDARRLGATGDLLRAWVGKLDAAALAALEPKAPTVSGQAVWPLPVTPNGDGWADAAAASYTIDEPSTVDVKLYDASWRLLRVSSARRYSGRNSERLDLRGPDGRPLKSGFYRFAVVARNQRGSHTRAGVLFVAPEVRVAPEMKTIPRLSRVAVSRPAPMKARLQWTQSSSAYVTVKVYSGAGLVKTLLYNNGRMAGAQNVTWDGTDSSGRPVPPGTYAYFVMASGGGAKPAVHSASGYMPVGP